MKKMNKMRFLAKTIISSFVLLAIFTACEVGLGSNVDTAAPKIEILSPEPSSTHKGEFQITGTASDEIAVRSVSVNLLENGTARYSYKANYDAASGKWSVSIPTLDENNKPIVEDLKYEIQAIATDTDGKTSVATRSVQVDNSAPTVLVNSPSLFNENKSTFFRQLRVSGSAYDASEISSVKVSFYKESKEGEVPFELVEGETMLTFTAEGTNTWELTKDLDEKDTFFANNTIYNFFVVAEDITGNKNTYFFRYGDFYKPGILEDVNKDSFISFPSMQQIGKLDQGFDIENATSNLTAQKLETIQIPCSSDSINDSNFYYRSQTASNVSWGNIENNDSSEPKQIPMEMDITGQIKSTDGTDILTNSIKFEIYSLDDNENWIVPSENMELDSSGSTVAFTIKLQKEAEEYIKSGHYRITVYYQTIASQNSDPLSAEKIFDISAGMPILTETGLSEKGTSPFNLQVFTNKDSVVLSGRALKGDRRTPVDMISVICNENSYESPEIAADGTWSIKITEEGTYSFELKVEDGGNTTTVTRTVIIDRTKPLIDNLGFNQNSAKNAVTISSFITDENAIESIHYAFVKGDSVTLENLDSTEWKKADNKSAMNIALEEPNGFEQGPWTLFVKATDKAGNIENKQYTGVLDLDAPAFTTSFATDSIPENGYLNKDFSYLSSILDNSTVIAADNYKIKEVKITAKKDGVVQNEYGYTKTIEKAQLTKADFDKLPIIEAKTTNEGKWIVTFEIYDLNNNKAEKTVDFSMDVTKPTVSIEKVPQAKDDNTSPFEFRGSASDNVSGVSTICVSLDGSNFESFEGLKSWGKELAITAKGNGWVFAYAIDGAGNISETVEKKFIFDSSKPTLNITTQEGLTDWNIGTNFGLEGTVSDDWGLPESPVTIKQYEKSGESLTNEILLSGVSFVDGKWSISDLPRKNPAEKIEEADIPTKTYTYEIEAKDNAGKESTKTVNVSIDKTAPSKNEISTPKDKLGTNAINSETFTFTGVAEDLEGDARTGINKIQYAIKTTDTEPTENELKDVATTGSWKFVNEEKLTEGEYFLFVRAVDNAGNKTAFAKEKYQVDFNNPEIDISLDAKQKGLFTLAGNISDKDATGQSNGKNITIEITQVGNLDKNKQPLVITPAVEETQLTTINLPVKSVEGQVVSITKDEIHDYNDTYTYTIKVTDWCGKTVEKTITTKLDTKAPVIELYSLSKSDSSQNVFKTESISLTGSLSDDSKITKLAYMTKLASEDKPKYEASGWTVKENKNTINEELSFTEAEYGNRVLYIWAEDENGNKSSIEKYNFLVDAKAPELTLTSSENAQINAGESYKLSLEATDSLLDKVVVTAKKDGVTQTGIWFEKPANGGNTITLEDEEILKGAGNEGKWVFSVKAYDIAGGVSDTETISVLVDTTNPEFKTDVNQPHIESTFKVKVGEKVWYGGQTITLKGQVSDNNEIETVEYLIVEEAEGASYESCSVTKIGDGEYEFKADISVTEHWDEKPIKIRASDSVGNEKTEEITVNVDRKVPTIKITSDTSNIFIKSETDLTLALDCDDAECGVKSVKAKIGSPVFNVPDAESDDFTSLTILAAKFPKDDGDMGTVFLQIEDNCGNTAQTSFTFRKDTTKPVIKFSSHKADDLVDGKITLSGTIDEAQGLDTSSVTVTTEFKSDIDQELDTSSVTVGDVTVEGLNWSCPIQTGADGDLTITVKAKDSAGNEGTNSITLNVNQKNDRPQIEISNDIYEIDGKCFIEDPKIYFSSSDEDGIDEIKINDEATTKSYTIPSGDGEKKLSFYVKDVDGKEFYSYDDNEKENDYVDAPVLKYKVTKTIETTEKITTEKTTKSLSFNLNLDSPKINSVQMKIGEEEPKDFDIKQIGGKTDKFDILVSATDGNGIKAVSLKAGGKQIPGTYEGTDETQNGIWKISVDTSELPEGEIDFVIEVTDKGNKSSTKEYKILVDKTPPTVEVGSHEIGAIVTGAVNIFGNADDEDGSGVKLIKWLIPTTEEVKASDDAIIGLPNWQDVTGTFSWSYLFENIDDDNIEKHTELKNYVTDDNKGNYGTEIDSTNIWELPIYLLVEDNVGNNNLVRNFWLKVDPDGDKPKASISHPTPGLTLGGIIGAYGEAKDNEGVKEVHIQIDTNGDGYFNDTDKTKLESIYTDTDNNVFETTDTWYIKHTTSLIWQLSIDSSKVLDTTKNNNKIKIRVRAKDIEDTVGLWSEPVEITVDKDIPVFDANKLRLVQYKDDVESASMKYEPDMWVSGDWTLVGTVQDDEKINKLEYGNTEILLEGPTTEDIGGKPTNVYQFEIPLDTDSGTGNISFTLVATDETNKTAQYPISIKFDNTAPVLQDLIHNDNPLGNIEQTNDGYEISSLVEEAGSGFERLAIYFKRGDDVFDPVIEKGKTGNRVKPTFKNNLPRLSITGARSDENTIKFALANFPLANIREGGLVLIAGVERKIEDVIETGDTVTVKFTPAAPEEATEADFAYALIVDNTQREIKGDTGSDDGDKFVEFVEKTGTKYNWEMTINSKNIPDGPIDICYVAYDKAGNATDLTTVSTSVQNNRPAIAKVWLGTDLDGDETISNSEEVLVRDVEANDVDKKRSENADNVMIDATSIFTAKDITTIHPEIVGGNGALYYYIDFPNIDSPNHSKIELREKEDTDIIPIKLTVAELEGYDEQTPNFKIKIWDSTEECTVGENTQWAQLSVQFKVDVVDSNPPTDVAISPLFWNSETDNSLYNNSRNNGHIDLKDDKSSGNDKVSGKIVIRGTAKDDKRLTALNMYIDSYGMGNTDTGSRTNADNTALVQAATYANGVWTSKIDGFTVTDNVITQEGHSVEWEYVWDSALITNVAQNDIKIHVSAEDTPNTTNAPDYTVDVVPYITGIVRTATTNSNTTTNRSTYGEYPIAVGDTIQVTGFNLGTAFKVGNTGVTGTVNTATKVYTLSGITNSGELTVTVNGVTNINASNNNSKAYNQDVGNAKWFDNCYLRVWDVDHYFSDSTGGNMPTMIADKKGNLFSSWTLMGSATVQLQRNLKNGTQKPSYAGYDQPDKITAFAVDKSEDNGDLSVLFLPANVGNGGKVTNIGYANGKNVGGAWGQGISNDLSSISTSFGTNKKVTITSNPTHAIDGTTWVAGFQLASYAMGREVSTFETPRTARYGDKLHYVWYDARNKSLKYSFIDMENYGLDTANNAYRYNVDGWTVIDGTSTGIDRVHAKVVNGKGTITTSTDIFSVGSTAIDSSSGTATDANDFSRLTATLNPANGNTQSCTVKLNSNESLNEATDVSIAIMYTDDVGNFCYDLHDVTSKSVTNNEYTFTWNTTNSCETPFVYLKDNNGNITENLTRYTVAIYFGARNVVSSESSSAGKYSSLDVTKTGKPVLVYYDGENETLRVAYCKVDSNCNLASNWAICETGVSGGTYVQAKIDPKNNLHIMYRDSDGQLRYIKSKSNQDGDGPDGEAYTFEEPMVIETSGTYGTLSLMNNNDTYVPCVAFLNSEGTANGVKYSLLRDVDTGLRDVDTGAAKPEKLWDTMVVPAVVSGGENHYITGGELVYVEGKSGSWSETQDTVNTADCDAIVGFNTGRMDVVFLKSENIETTSQQ